MTWLKTRRPLLLRLRNDSGQGLLNWFKVNTFDPSKGDRATQGYDCLQRCLKHGKDALIIKAADKLENSYYLNPVLDEEFCKFWVAEMRFFIDNTRPVLMDEQIWRELSWRCEQLEATFQ